MKNRNKIVPAVFMIFRRNDKILILRRAGSGYHDGHYSLPAGHIESGESATEAAVREAWEELGIELSVDQLEFAHALYRRAEDANHERVDIFFNISKFYGEPYIMEPHKCDELNGSRLASCLKI